MEKINTVGLVVMIAITVVSVLVVWRTLVTASRGTRGVVTVSDTAEAGESDLDDLVTAIALIEAQGERDFADLRDPLRPYVRRRSTTTTSTATRRTAPSLKVQAVVLDQDPRAVVLTDGKRKTVRLGDDTGAGTVVGIEPDGVTIEGSSGTKKYPYPPK